MLSDFYFHDERVVLVPAEHLSPAGMSADFAALVQGRCGWDPARVALFDNAFRLYWERSSTLARRTRTWPPPRVRNVAVVHEPLTVRPYAQLLNTGTWTLYECDFDPAVSNPELPAYLFVHGDWMSWTGEVTEAGVRCAAYWFERTAEERAAFAAAAAQSPRPDADGFRAIADATSWLKDLHHQTLRPAPRFRARPISRSGLLVPAEIEARPPTLIAEWVRAANDALAEYCRHWRTPDREAVDELCAWLLGDRPPLLVIGNSGRVLWEPDAPERQAALRAELRGAGGAAVRDVHADLKVVADRTRAFFDLVLDRGALPAPDPRTEQAGYVYLHRERRRIAYDLHEPGIERLDGIALPYARAMLGARTVHEWAHLAADAGWVVQSLPDKESSDLLMQLGEKLDATITAVPVGVRRETADDLAQLHSWARGARAAPHPFARTAVALTPGQALVSLLLARMPDYQANVILRLLADPVERETYVRHNIRTLRPEYPPARLWRMLARYLYEYQYLQLSAMCDPRHYFLRATWFDVDFLQTGLLDDQSFDLLTGLVGRYCAGFRPDPNRIRIGPTVNIP